MVSSGEAEGQTDASFCNCRERESIKKGGAHQT